SDQIGIQMNALSFDIESNIQCIYEMAWNNSEMWYSYKGEKEVTNALILFNQQIEDEQNLVIGHNIIEFDCPILEKKGVVINSDKLWDTLRIEVLLSPELRNYALKTEHNAKKDAQLTLSLFTNQ